jgi:uncharacterized protein DUF3303
MLFAVHYTARDVTEEKEKRSLNLFTNWKPPAGYEFKAHYALLALGVGERRVPANRARSIRSRAWRDRVLSLPFERTGVVPGCA